MQPFGNDPSQPPANSIDRESTEQMLVEGQGAAFGSSDSEDTLYPDANPLFDGGGEQKFSEFFDPGPAPMMGSADGDMSYEGASMEPSEDDRAGLHQALVDQMATVKDNSEGYQEQVVEQNKQGTKPYNM